MKTMRVMNHATDESIPLGMATLVMDDNGWVGTSTGHPYLGKPALYPEAQAEALAYAWGFLMERGVRVFSADAKGEVWKSFRGLALFDTFPVHADVLSWMDSSKRMGPRHGA